MVALVRYADRAGLRAPVPSCPEWKVRHLLAHQGMVHRWATGALRGQRVDTVQVEREGMNETDPLDWLRDGAIELVKAVVSADDDVPAPVFLPDAPAPRGFWARRQCHETTIHAVDALSAALGWMPTAADADWVSPELALDGIDELLRGFWVRERFGLRPEQPFRLAVLPEGAARGWVVELSAAPAVTTVVEVDRADGDVVLRGGPVGLYLTLWNRSDESTDEAWQRWRSRTAIGW